MRRGARLLLLLLLTAAFTATGLPKLHAHDLPPDGPEEPGRHHHDAAVDPLDSSALGALLHGHTHPEPVPEHSHRIAPTIPSRLDLAGLPLPGELALRPAPLAEPPRLGADAGASPLPAGLSPPSRLHWLCTLLI